MGQNCCYNSWLGLTAPRAQFWHVTACGAPTSPQYCPLSVHCALHSRAPGLSTRSAHCTAMCNLYNGGVQHACTWCAKRNLYILWCSVQCGRLDTLTNRFGPSWWYLPPPPHCLSYLPYLILVSASSLSLPLMPYAPSLLCTSQHVLPPLIPSLPLLNSAFPEFCLFSLLPLLASASLCCQPYLFLPSLSPEFCLSSLLPLLTSASLCCQPSLFLPCLSPF